MDRPLRPLRPDERTGARATVIPQGMPKRQKRQTVRVACNSCRARRAACDSKRPVCTPCARRETECVWRAQRNDETVGMALKRENESLKTHHGYSIDELMSIFDTLPEEARIATLRRLAVAERERRSRGGRSLDDGAQLLPSLSEQDTALSVLPPIRSKVEFELMVRHPNAYSLFFHEAPRRAPSDTPPSDQELSSISATPSHQELSSISASPSHQELSSIPAPPVAGGSLRSRYRQAAKVAFGGSTIPNSDRTDSRSEVRYCDDRLHGLQIDPWTEVPITNDFAAQAISIFLETTFPILGLFDSDLFLEDLVTTSRKFCSSFLVASLLFCACIKQACSSINPAGSMISLAFFDEAEKMQQSELGGDSLPSLSALALMSIGCIYQGKDDRAAELMEDMIEMGRRMSLFGTDISEDALQTFLDMPDDLLRASAHTAWGIYNWVSLYSLHYHEPGAKVPPVLPIPGHHVDDSQDNLAVRVSQYALPSYVGHTFTDISKLWAIFQEMTLVYYDADLGPVGERVDVAFAISLHQKLLGWADRLPASTTCSETSPHHVIILHMLYHIATLDVFRPFIRQQLAKRTTSASTVNQYADSVSAASVKQLQQLMHLYATRQKSATYTILWHTSMLYVANALFQDHSDPGWHSYFFLCLEGYRDLVGSFPVAESILRGLLAMAMHLGIISVSDARDIFRQAREKGKHHRIRQDLRANFMVDLSLALSSREDAKVERVARRFEQLALMTTPASQ